MRRRCLQRLLPCCFVLGSVVGFAQAGDTVRERDVDNFAQRPRVRSPNNARVDSLPGVLSSTTVEGADAQAAAFPGEFRSIDGRGNNLSQPGWGAANAHLLRLTRADYADRSGAPSGQGRASARAVSNRCLTQSGQMPSSAGISDFFWQWGQFLDHDISLTPVAEHVEAFDIPVPAADRWFDPGGTGSQVISLDRSFYQMAGGVRQQVNQITAFIDASNVYGSDTRRAAELRSRDGSGRLKTSRGNLLPFNNAGLPNAPDNGASFFLAGDFRANEQVGLLALHTLFVREHNFWAERIARDNPGLSDDQIYEHARAVVAAEMQAITYREFLPLLLGNGALPPYGGYDARLDPGIANVFATAAYRVGHTMLSGQLQRLDASGRPIRAGHIPLAQAFFAPREITAHGIDPLLRGLAAQRAQEVDVHLVDDVRNFLFGPPGAGGFDLGALNIQRGRDHGLPSYNQVRIDYGLRPASSFADVSRDGRVQAALRDVYTTVDEIDVWVGGLAEDKVRGALVGETFFVILRDQFRRLRDGDRFWYESYLPGDMVQTVNQQTLADIVRRNTSIGSELPRNVFRSGR